VLFAYAAVAVLVLSLACIGWWSSPAYPFTVALVLAPFAGHWSRMGIPTELAPERLCVLFAAAATIARAPGVAERVPFRLHPAHVLCGAALVYATASAIASGTLGSGGFLLLDTFGVLPFLAFATAPLAFRTTQDRNVLVCGMVVLGAYLGLTALFETVHLRSLVFPRYINDPTYGIHFGRARGPFVEAVENGVGLFACCVVSLIAVASWRRPGPRTLAAAVALLCAVGTIFTLQRSIWLATIVGAAVGIGGVRSLRGWALPAVALAVSAVTVTLAVVPGLSARVAERRSQEITLWDRENLDTAALNMVGERPLTGFGFDRFPTDSREHFQQSPDHPITAFGESVHNVFLGYAAELGLLGLTLWVGALGTAAVVAVRSRPPPDVELWRRGLVAFLPFVVVVTSFVPPYAFPNLALWLWFGVVWSGRVHQEVAPAVRTGPLRPSLRPA
jgi:O-antigen ligase